VRWQLKKNILAREGNQASAVQSVDAPNKHANRGTANHNCIFKQRLSVFFRKPKHAACFGKCKNCLEIHLWQTVVCRSCTTMISLACALRYAWQSCKNYRNFADIKDIKTRGRGVDWGDSGQCVVVSNFVFHPAINQALLTSRDDLIRVLPAVVIHLFTWRSSLTCWSPWFWISTANKIIARR
jgi:hypothetical protein